MAQLVEHILGKDEVPSSNLGSSSKKSTCGCRCFLVCPPSACRRGISDLRFGERSARRPVRHCARIFTGLCTAVASSAVGVRARCTLSFIIINHKLRLTAGRLRLRVRAFAAVCGISLPCAAFSFAAELPQIPAKMRDLRRNHFFAVGTHSRSVLRLSAEKIFLRTRAVGRRCLSDGFSVRIAGGENAFVKAPKNDTFCKFERKFIHFTQFFIDKRRCLPYN